jgi:hypothetical protein
MAEPYSPADPPTDSQGLAPLSQPLDLEGMLRRARRARIARYG